MCFPDTGLSLSCSVSFREIIPESPDCLEPHVPPGWPTALICGVLKPESADTGCSQDPNHWPHEEMSVYKARLAAVQTDCCTVLLHMA